MNKIFNLVFEKDTKDLWKINVIILTKEVWGEGEGYVAGCSLLIDNGEKYSQGEKFFPLEDLREAKLEDQKILNKSVVPYFLEEFKGRKEIFYGEEYFHES